MKNIKNNCQPKKSQAKYTRTTFNYFTIYLLNYYFID